MVGASEHTPSSAPHRSRYHPPSPQSLLAAVKSSFGALRRRLAPTAGGGALFLDRPLFGVDLQLRVPAVVLSPSLDEIQEAINNIAKKARAGGMGESRGTGQQSHTLSRLPSLPSLFTRTRPLAAHPSTGAASGQAAAGVEQ